MFFSCRMPVALTCSAVDYYEVASNGMDCLSFRDFLGSIFFF